MRKKVVTGICILLAIVLLIPIPMRLKDGGTVVYNAILYQVENVHRIDPEATSENDYLEGMIVKILGIEVYNRSKISRNYWLFEPKCRNNAEITYTQRLQIASYFP